MKKRKKKKARAIRKNTAYRPLTAPFSIVAEPSPRCNGRLYNLKMMHRVAILLLLLLPCHFAQQRDTRPDCKSNFSSHSIDDAHAAVPRCRPFCRRFAYPGCRRLPQLRTACGVRAVVRSLVEQRRFAEPKPRRPAPRPAAGAARCGHKSLPPRNGELSQKSR